METKTEIRFTVHSGVIYDGENIIAKANQHDRFGNPKMDGMCDLVRRANLVPELLEALELVESALSTYREIGAFTPGQPSGYLLQKCADAITRAKGGNS